MRRSIGRLSFSLCAIAIGCSKPARGPDAAARTTPAPIVFPATWPFADTVASVTAAHGMVATDAPIATHVGAAVLRNGGNAVDAAIATE